MTQTTNNSFTSFYSQDAQRSTQRGNSNRKPSEGQVKFYSELCLRKRQVPANLSEVSSAQLGDMIETLLAMPEPASDKQLQMLRDMFTELIELGDDKIKMPSDKWFFSLTGGREGSASEWIEKTRKRRTQFYSVMKPSEQQLETLVSWYLCPDIPWADLPTKTVKVWDDARNEYYDSALAPVRTRITMEDIFIAEGVPAWRKMTMEEFRTELSEKLTYSIASRTIDQYRGVFFEWRRSRIAPGRIEYIRSLEKRLANLRAPKRLVITEEGDYDLEAPFTAREEYAPVAYTEMPMDEIVLIDEEHAQTFIDQLRSELEATELYNTSQNVTTYEYFDREEFNYALRSNPKNIIFSHFSRGKGVIDRQEEMSQTFEPIRQANNMADWKTQEFTALNDFLHSLQAISGFEMDGLREEIGHVFFTYSTDGTDMAGASKHVKRQLKQMVVSHMLEAVRTEAIGIRQLGRIAQNSEVANEIFVKMITKPKYAKMLAMDL